MMRLEEMLKDMICVHDKEYRIGSLLGIFLQFTVNQFEVLLVRILPVLRDGWLHSKVEPLDSAKHVEVMPLSDALAEYLYRIS